MNLEQFGEELAQARLAKGISLIDISAETRINLKFLEAIERGQFQILPQTYVRAFLREYALGLGLDPIDVLQRYNSVQQEGRTRKSDEIVTQNSSPQTGISTGDLKNQVLKLSPLQRNLAFGIFLVVVVGLVIFLANMKKESDFVNPVVEIPFDRVIRESEAASILPPSAAIDSVPAFKAPQKDSLRLEITTLDSVWISLLIDDTKGAAYLFAPNRKRMWAAKERFVVTMGNAGGATFRLNGKDIGSLGKRGAIVRNSILTEANLNN
jgi:transcriptional regulator with XRE-family HTH domain